jgi:hypothetical protein
LSSASLSRLVPIAALFSAALVAGPEDAGVIDESDWGRQRIVDRDDRVNTLIKLSRRHKTRAEKIDFLVERTALAHVDEYAKDCGFRPKASVTEPTYGRDVVEVDECLAREYEQNCALHSQPRDCYGEMVHCKDACSPACTNCDAKCASACTLLKRKCSGNSPCTKDVAVERARCHARCVAERDVCREGDCADAEYACWHDGLKIRDARCPSCIAWENCDLRAQALPPLPSEDFDLARNDEAATKGLLAHRARITAARDECKRQMPMPPECYDWCAQ